MCSNPYAQVALTYLRRPLASGKLGILFAAASSLCSSQAFWFTAAVEIIRNS